MFSCDFFWKLCWTKQTNIFRRCLVYLLVYSSTCRSRYISLQEHTKYWLTHLFAKLTSEVEQCSYLNLHSNRSRYIVDINRYGNMSRVLSCSHLWFTPLPICSKTFFPKRIDLRIRHQQAPNDGPPQQSTAHTGRNRATASYIPICWTVGVRCHAGSLW